MTQYPTNIRTPSPDTPAAPKREIDLDGLEATARAATPGIWQQGRLLHTQTTAKMDEFYRAANQEIEARKVFTQFKPEDEGRSRILVADTLSPEDAAFIAAFNPAVALDLLGCLRAAERERDELRDKFALVQSEDMAKLAASLKVADREMIETVALTAVNEFLKIRALQKAPSHE